MSRQSDPKLRHHVPRLGQGGRTAHPLSEVEQAPDGCAVSVVGKRGQWRGSRIPGNMIVSNVKRRDLDTVARRFMNAPHTDRVQCRRGRP